MSENQSDYNINKKENNIVKENNIDNNNNINDNIEKLNNEDLNMTNKGNENNIKIINDNSNNKDKSYIEKFNIIENMNINDIIYDLKREINELEQCLNPKNFKNRFDNLEKKEKFFILFLWLIWLINITIYITGDLSILFFSGVGTITYIFTITLCSLIVIVETLNIINRRDRFFCYEYLLFSAYFWILFFILFKSLLNTKGWGWQFYLIMILINSNLIIIPKFNATKFDNDIDKSKND